jgi:phosphoribosylformylglycinamidine cyclo-ligase
LFKLIQQQSATDWSEMYKVFNMGHRMEIYIDEKNAGRIVEISKSFGVDAKVIGRVEASQEKMVTVKGAHGNFSYR